MFYYKPGFVALILQVSNPSFRYWRQVLDPMPFRNRFSFPIVIAYAVIKYLVEAWRYNPNGLKQMNFDAFFDWFSKQDDIDTILDTVLEVNMRSKTFRFYKSGSEPVTRQINTQVIHISLRYINDEVMSAFQRGTKVFEGGSNAGTDVARAGDIDLFRLTQD